MKKSAVTALILIICLIGTTVSFGQDVINVKRSGTGYSFSAESLYSGNMYIATYKDDILCNISIVQGTPAQCGYAYLSMEDKCPEGFTMRCFLWNNDLVPIAISTEALRSPETLFSELRDKWRTYYAPSVADAQQEEFKAILNRIYADAMPLFLDMNQGDGIKRLWGESDEGYTTTAGMTYAYENVYKMALAWASEGQALYKNEELKEKIVYAVEWLNANYYGEKETLSDGTGGWRSMYEHDWWDWFVGTPQHLLHTILLMGDTFTKEQTDKYLIPFDYATQNMRVDLTLESNVNSRAYVIMLASVIRNNQEEIDKLVDSYKILFEITDSGTGMYNDYSYIKHNMIPYNGFYGTGALLDRVIKIMAITGGTPFKLNDEYLNVYVNWIKYAFEPLLVNGGMMSMVRGRGIEKGTEDGDAIAVFASMLDILPSLNKDDAAYFENMIIRHLKGERLLNAQKNLTINQQKTLNEVIKKDITPKDYIYTHIYHNMDRAVHHGKSFTVGLAMSSERIANYESLDNVNKKGWYTGDGMLYVYNKDDINQFNPDYFQNVNPYKMPGTTVDTQEREEISIAYGEEYFSNQSFVGGTSLENSAALAMQLESFHNDIYKDIENTGGGEAQPLHNSSLMAKKSWFIFDDEIVCLGTDINANDGFGVHTIIENRKMQTGKEAFVANSDYAYIEGTGGYYFPDKPEIYTNISNTGDYIFYEMWFDHGVNPDNSAYSYVILPTKNESETASYASNPNIDILNNTSSVQAVYDKSTDTYGYVFWEAAEFDGIEIANPLILMKKPTDNGLLLTFSDPTHKLLNTKITLEGIFSCDTLPENITLDTDSGKTIITIDLTNSGGETFALTLTN